MRRLAVVTLMVGAALTWAAPVATATGVSWATYGFDEQRTGYNRSESTIGTGNAAKLHVLWSVDLGDVMIAQPVHAAAVNVNGVATDVVYEGTEHGDFYALRASDGHVLWHRNLGSIKTNCFNMPDGVFGIGGAAAIAFTGPGTGLIYVAPNRPDFVSHTELAQKPLDQTHMVLSFAAPGYRNPEIYRLQVLSSLLGGGMSSRLFQEVREKRGLCYSVFSFASAYEDAGQFGVYAATSPDDTPELVDVTADVMLSTSA